MLGLHLAYSHANAEGDAFLCYKGIISV